MKEPSRAKPLGYRKSSSARDMGERLYEYTQLPALGAFLRGLLPTGLGAGSGERQGQVTPPESRRAKRAVKGLLGERGTPAPQVRVSGDSVQRIVSHV